MNLFELDCRSLAVLDKIVAEVTPADLDRPTPCTGWTLADLLRHQISENHGFALAARDGSAANWDSGHLGDDAYGAYHASVEEFLAAFGDDTVLERQLVIGEHGTFPGQIALAMHLVDTVTHGWDLAKTFGVTYDPDAEAVHAALVFAEQIPADPIARVDQGTFAPVVDVSDDASEADRLVALLGRSPEWPG